MSIMSDPVTAADRKRLFRIQYRTVPGITLKHKKNQYPLSGPEIVGGMHPEQ